MPKVLIVEDDEAMAIALRDGFVYEGYDVRLARDGSAGLKQATENSPDLIILDVMLPKMSGLDICRKIRQNGNRIPNTRQSGERCLDLTELESEATELDLMIDAPDEVQAAIRPVARQVARAVQARVRLDREGIRHESLGR